MTEGEHKHDSEKHEHASHEAHHEVHHHKSRNMAPMYIVITTIVFLAVGILASPMIMGVPAAVTKEAAAAKAVSYINTNLVQAGQSVSANFTNDTGSMYEVKLSMSGRDVGSVYVSKDGKYIILGTVLDMNEAIPKEDTSSGNQQQQPSTTPKTDKPVVELYVMSFCPYGVQAEAAMAPVVDLLKSKADIKVRFIASIGDTVDSVQSLHGVVEGKEDIRQLCVAKNYDTATYWKYLAYINAKCYPIYRNGEDGYNTCWKAAAANASIDTAKIESCMAGEGVALLKGEETASNANGVSGSPTLLINGVRYNGARTAEAFKTAICNAFTTAPAECGQALSGATAQAAGSC
jgi:protein-disulfide isomerase